MEVWASRWWGGDRAGRDRTKSVWSAKRGAQINNERLPEHSPPPKHQLTPRAGEEGAGQRFVQGVVRGVSLFLKAVHGTGAEGGHVATRRCAGTVGGRKGCIRGTGSSTRTRAGTPLVLWPPWIAR